LPDRLSGVLWAILTLQTGNDGSIFVNIYRYVQYKLILPS